MRGANRVIRSDGKKFKKIAQSDTLLRSAGRIDALLIADSIFLSNL